MKFIRQHAALNKIETIVVIEAAVAEQNGEALFDPAPALPPVIFQRRGPYG